MLTVQLHAGMRDFFISSLLQVGNNKIHIWMDWPYVTN